MLNVRSLWSRPSAAAPAPQAARVADPEAIAGLVRHDGLLRLVQYWFRKRGGRLVTRRVDIDPTEMPWILPFAWLYDYEPDTRRFRCRLAGDEVRSTYQMNIVGKYLNEFLLAKNWPVIEAHYRAVVEMPAIGYAAGQVYRTSLDKMGYGERVTMPLSDETGERVTMLLGATVLRESDGAPIESMDRALYRLRP